MGTAFSWLEVYIIFTNLPKLIESQQFFIYFCHSPKLHDRINDQRRRRASAQYQSIIEKIHSCHTFIYIHWRLRPIFIKYLSFALVYD